MPTEITNRRIAIESARHDVREIVDRLREKHDATDDEIRHAFAMADICLAGLERLQAPEPIPQPSNPGRTHYEGCWRDRGHHDCAVAMIERLQAPEPEPCGVPTEPGWYWMRRPHLGCLWQVVEVIEEGKGLRIRDGYWLWNDFPSSPTSVVNFDWGPRINEPADPERGSEESDR